MRSQKGSYLKRGADRTDDTILTNKVFHAMHVILGLKLGDHEGLPIFARGRLLKRTLLIVLPVILIQIPICAFLSPVPIYCRVQPRTSWCCLAATDTSTSGTQIRDNQYRFCIFCLISLSIISVISKAVSISSFYISLIFPLFSLLLAGRVGGE